MPQPLAGKPRSLIPMPSSTFDARAIAQVGFEALHKGDAHKARESFERVIAAGRADAAVHAALGYACLRLDDKSAALAAAEKALALDPRNLRALILKADHYAQSGRWASRGLVLSVRDQYGAAGHPAAARPAERSRPRAGHDVRATPENSNRSCASSSRDRVRSTCPLPLVSGSRSTFFSARSRSTSSNPTRSSFPSSRKSSSTIGRRSPGSTASKPRPPRSGPNSSR